MREENEKEPRRISRHSGTRITGGTSDGRRERIRAFDNDKGAEHEPAADDHKNEEKNEEKKEEGAAPKAPEESAGAENKSQRPAPRQPSRRVPAKKPYRPAGDPERFVHQIVPYAMFWVALFAAVSFVLRDLCHLGESAGSFGNVVADFLCGLLGVTAYLLPLFLVVIALRWKHFVETGLLVRKLLLSASFLWLLSAIIHIFQDGAAGRAVRITDAAVLYGTGVTRAGGGLFGGFLGEWLGFYLRLPGTCLLAIPVLLILGIYLVGLTPLGLWQRISCKLSMIKERRKRRTAELYEADTTGTDRGIAAEKGKGALPGGKDRWCEPQPLTRSDGRMRYEFGEESFRKNTKERKEAPPASQEKINITAARAEDIRAAFGESIVDIPEEDALPEELPAQPSSGARRILQNAGQSATHAETVEEALARILRETQNDEAAAPPAPESAPESAPAPVTETDGSCFSPFSLPRRPEPIRETAAPKDTGHIVIHAGEPPKSGTGQSTEGEEAAPMQEVSYRTPVTSDPEPQYSKSKPEQVVNEPWRNAFEPEPAPRSAEKETTAPPLTPAAGAPQSRTAQEERAFSFAEAEYDEELEATANGAGADEPALAQSAAPSESRSDGEIYIMPERPYQAPSVSPEPAPPQPEDTVPADGEAEDFEEDFLEESYRAFSPVVKPASSHGADPASGAAVRGSDTSSFGASTLTLEEKPASQPFSGSFGVVSRTEAVREPVRARTEPVREAPRPVPAVPFKDFCFPPMELLNEDRQNKNVDHTEEMEEKKEALRATLASFNIRIQEEVQCSRGPTITRYEVRPEAGTSVRSVTNHIDDISLNMAAAVRIEAPIPGKPAIGIEVPNEERETVYMRTLLESEIYQSSKKPLEIPLGIGIGGNVQMCDLAKMPHLLVAGTTGSGKSVCINTILTGLMYKTSPLDLRLILIDPKQVEFSLYEHVPHLYMPIVTDMKRAVGVLACAVAEMDRRYALMRDVGVREVDAYNEAVKNDPEREHLPKMVIVIDEFADLKMSVTNNDPETFTCRLAQKARAAGIHLIIGTQRPSVDVITGKLKANIPSRIAFTVKQQVDSRTILDANGAETLTGRGDMLYLPIGTQKPFRVQGAFVSDGEIDRVITYIREHNDPVHYNQEFMDQLEVEMARAEAANRKPGDGEGFSDSDEGGGEDAIFNKAVRLAVESQKVATSLLQRRLSIGYGRAAKLIDRMQNLGIVSPADGNKPRRVLITAEQYAKKMANEGGFSEGGDEDDFI